MQNVCKNFKIEVFEVDINNKPFPVIAMLKLTKVLKIKGNNSFRFQHLVDKHMVFGCKQSKINVKALQNALIEKKKNQTLRLFSI